MAVLSLLDGPLESMLNRMVSVGTFTARRALASIMGSSKRGAMMSIAARPFAVWPESRYESILRKCDLPEPKKPEIHTPILSVGASSARS